MEFGIKNTLLESLEIVLIKLEKNLVSASMPVSGKTKQIAGILHGGASAALLETVASIGSYLNIDTKTHAAVGTELNISHLSSMSEGFVLAEASPIRIGKSIHVWNVVITDHEDRNKIVATGRCSLFIKKLRTS
jgi:1,4-dihydroxy-2-naphthoyl-CoA hydrolase